MGGARPFSVQPDLDELQERLGYRFSQPALLRRALIHSSSRTLFSGSNERLEFLGDAILEAVVSIHLFAHHPSFQEGRMSQVRSEVVSRRAMAALGGELGLSRFLIVGRMFPDPDSISSSILSNAFEAIIGAVYLDGGMEAAHTFIMIHFEKILKGAAQEPGQQDWKSLLGQWSQRQHRSHPVYHLLSTAGPDHTRTFEMAVSIDTRRFAPAWGRSKKESEQRAARMALLELGLISGAP